MSPINHFVNSYYKSRPLSIFLEEFDNTVQKIPDYDIIATSDDNEYAYVIQVSLPGYCVNDIQVTREKYILTIKGKPPKEDHKYVHKGIFNEEFTLSFSIGDNLIDSHASLENGILCIFFKRVAPASPKVKTLKINNL